jgi:glycosyltransferase involved in cell wall biosynthesis
MEMNKGKNKLLVIGLERNPFNDNQFDALCAEGFDLHVVYTVDQKSTENNTHWLSFPDSKYTWSYLTGFRRILVLFKILQRPNRTIIFTGYASIYFVLAMFLCLAFNIRYLVFTDTPVIRKRVGFVKRVLKRLAIWVSFHLSSGVLTTGGSGREALLKLGCCDKKIINFPYTPSAQKFLETVNPESDDIFNLKSRVGNKLIIFYSSQLIYRKGLDVLICALDVLMKRDLEFHVIIEGDGPLRSYYEDLVQGLGMSPSFDFVGFSQSSVHARLLYLSHVVVSPSRWEPWGNIVPEAMEFGKLVVASDAVESANDRIRHEENGLIFSSDNVGELVGCLSLALTQVDLRKSMSEKARLTSQAWTSAVNAIFLRSFLES